MPFHKGFRTESKLSIPYGVAASASAAIAKAVIVLTFCCSSTKPASGICKTHNYKMETIVFSSVKITDIHKDTSCITVFRPPHVSDPSHSVPQQP